MFKVYVVQQEDGFWMESYQCLVVRGISGGEVMRESHL